MTASASTSTQRPAAKRTTAANTQKANRKNRRIFDSILEWDAVYTTFVWRKLSAANNPYSSIHNFLLAWSYFLDFTNSGFLWALLLPVVYACVFVSETYRPESWSPEVAAHWKAQLQFFMFCLGMDVAITGLLKAFIKRRRPVFRLDKGVLHAAESSSSSNGTASAGTSAGRHGGPGKLMIGPDRYSFPSGHCTRAIIVCVFATAHLINLMLVGYRDHLVLRTLGLAFILAWTVSMAPSRIALGRHYLLDCLLGYILGMFEIVISAVLWGQFMRGEQSPFSSGTGAVVQDGIAI